MTVREVTEKRELETLSIYASKAVLSKGTSKQRKECDYRTSYQRDRDRVLHSNAFRRLMHKTQVFLNPTGDHYTTRLTHTLEVSQIARTISRALFLNEDLTEAIALGHDLGHTPFGHAGERALNKVTPFMFYHAEQSIRVVEKLERKGEGLSLTFETLDGIKHHSKGSSKILESQVVYFADKIAYLNHDAEDAIRAKILNPRDFPKEVIENLGGDKSKRITSFIRSLVENSVGKDRVSFDEKTNNLFYTFRDFMFSTVYIDSTAKIEEYKAEHLVIKLYKYYQENIDELPDDYQKIIKSETEFGKERAVCDYISGMSDRFATTEYQRLFIPRSWSY